MYSFSLLLLSKLQPKSSAQPCGNSYIWKPWRGGPVNHFQKSPDSEAQFGFIWKSCYKHVKHVHTNEPEGCALHVHVSQMAAVALFLGPLDSLIFPLDSSHRSASSLQRIQPLRSSRSNIDFNEDFLGGMGEGLFQRYLAIHQNLVSLSQWAGPTSGPDLYKLSWMHGVPHGLLLPMECAWKCCVSFLSMSFWEVFVSTTWLQLVSGFVTLWPCGLFISPCLLGQLTPSHCSLHLWNRLIISFSFNNYGDWVRQPILVVFKHSQRLPWGTQREGFSMSQLPPFYSIKWLQLYQFCIFNLLHTTLFAENVL